MNINAMVAEMSATNYPDVQLQVVARCLKLAQRAAKKREDIGCLATDQKLTEFEENIWHLWTLARESWAGRSVDAQKALAKSFNLRMRIIELALQNFTSDSVRGPRLIDVKAG